MQWRTQGGCTGCTCIPPPPPPCASPPGHVHPPQPERLVMRKDEAVGNKKKMQVCLPKHNYKFDNHLLTVDLRAVDPHCFDAIQSRIRIQLKILIRIRIQIQIRGAGVVQPKMCIPPGKILGTPLGGWPWKIGNLEFFGSQMSLAYQLDAISQGPKNSRIPGPNPLPLALVMDMHVSKTYTGLYKS